MTPEQKRLVEHTWKQAAPIADAAAEIFYRRLLEIDPSRRKLFRATDMVAQRKKLLQTLSFAINGLNDLDALASKVEDLGRRHARYGVTDAQFDSVGAALLWTLQQGLGQRVDTGGGVGMDRSLPIAVAYHAQSRRGGRCCPATAGGRWLIQAVVKRPSA